MRAIDTKFNAKGTIIAVGHRAAVMKLDDRTVPRKWDGEEAEADALPVEWEDIQLIDVRADPSHITVDI